MKLQKILKKSVKWYKTSTDLPRILKVEKAANNNLEKVFNKKLQESAVHFSPNRWAYIEDPINENFRKKMESEWPPDFYLNETGSEMKIQLVGFKWGAFMTQQHIAQHTRYLNRFPYLRTFLLALRSKSFAKDIQHLIGADEPMACYYTSVRTAYEGGWLEFHKDGHGEFSSIRDKNVNISWHIGGKDGKYSGGLSLASCSGRKIPEESIIHETSRLNNSCLVYGMDANLFHGYLPMKSGTFRHVVTSQFIPASQINSNEHMK